MKYYPFLLLTIAVLSSCSSTKSLDIVSLQKGNLIYGLEEKSGSDLVNQTSVKILESKSGAKVKLELTENDLKIYPYDSSNDFQSRKPYLLEKDIGSTGKSFKLLDKYSHSSNVASGNILKEIGKKGFDTSEVSQKESGIYEGLDFKKSIPLRYNDNKMILQTLTIPFKLRRRQGDVPSTVSTNFNTGLAYGYQWNLSNLYPIYGNVNKMVGYELEEISFSLAPFGGLTTIALKANNTEPDITTEQTVMGFSVGAAGVFAFNNLNLGLALGIDHGFGRADDWVYQDKLWIGIVIGLDLIK